MESQAGIQTGSMTRPIGAVPARSMDESEFAALYEQCRLPVFRYLRSRTRSEDEAADLAATAFERAFRAFARFDPNEPPLPWLLRIAHNVAIDAARRRRPLLSLHLIETRDQPLDPSSLEDDALRSERDDELRGLVLALPEPQRDAIALRYAVGLSARQIGTVIGRSEGATQKLLERALVALREARDGKR